MLNIRINNINLINYRNISNLSLTVSNNIILIIGDNGSGKTNILESISLLLPGRGIRAAKFNEICKIGEKYWYSMFDISSKMGLAIVEMSFSALEKIRNIKYNNQQVASNELDKLNQIIWITPQMEYIFLSKSQERRKFFDRIVYNFDPIHRKSISVYEYYIKERLSILKLDNHILHDTWLDVIEEKIAISAFEILDKRAKFIQLIQIYIDKLDVPLSKPELFMDDIISGNKFNQCEFLDYCRSKMKRARLVDREIGRTTFNPANINFLATHKKKNIIANMCSTGEQKSMLATILLAQINMIMDETKISPILLLDEFFAHLDDIGKNSIIDYILNSNMQVFITSTNIRNLGSLQNYAQIIKL